MPPDKAQKKGCIMERKSLIICPLCRKVRKFGEWTELTYSDRLTVNAFTVEEIRRICDDCQLDSQGKVRFASNA